MEELSRAMEELLSQEVKPVDKMLLEESLRFCFTNSFSKEDTVTYIIETCGKVKEDVITRGFDIMKQAKSIDPSDQGEDILLMVGETIIKDCLALCLKHSLSEEACIRYIIHTHNGLFEEELIKQVFDTMSQSQIKKRQDQGEADKDAMVESLTFCFIHYFTKEETLEYLGKRHSAKECDDIRISVDRLISQSKDRDPNYEDEVASRSSFRKLLRQETEWTTREKMQLIEKRLSLLSQETRNLVRSFSRLEIETLGFFISKFPEEEVGGVPYARRGRHRICFHCHCYDCYYRFLKILESFSDKKKKVIDQVLYQCDVAVLGKEEEKKEEVGGEKTKPGKKKKKSRGKKSNKKK